MSNAKIDCEFAYFSDDFYFYCNKYNNDKVIKIFDKVLEKHNLERNDNKKEIWTYENFNNYNLVERYWKKLIADCNTKFNKDINNNNKYFINQLIYRMSKLADDKLKKVFINNFFKTKYFQTLDLNNYQVKDYNYHQLSFILKFSPEAMLYAINKFNMMCSFDNSRLYKFFEIRYQEPLNKPFNEEQLYFYFAIKILKFNDILSETKEAVLKSNNKILISYYLKDKLFNEEDIDILKMKVEESYWFQNYHLILYTDLSTDLDNNIKKYLIPKNANKEKKKKSYLDFYKYNIELSNSLIKDIEDVTSEIQNYLRLKIAESEASFVAEKEKE